VVTNTKELEAASDSRRVDKTHVEIEKINEALRNKIDSRRIITHNFTTTSEEAIEHNLNLVPTSVFAGVGTGAAIISKGATAWTKKRIYLISSVQPNNEVPLLVL